MTANLERLKKRIKALEEWTDENEALAGPEGTLDTMNYLISRVRQADQMQAHLNQLQGYLQEYLNETESMEQWNEFIKIREEGNNAVQEQQTEEVSVQEEAESGEETVEAPEEESSETKD